MEGQEEQADPFADLEEVNEDDDVANLRELVAQIDSDITAEQYLDCEEDLSTCLTFSGADETNWRDRLRSTVVMDSLARGCESSDEEEVEEEEDTPCTSIKSFDGAVTLAKDFFFFWWRKEQKRELKISRE